MAKENEIPYPNLKEMEPTSYADGDFDIGVWHDEILDLKADDVLEEHDFEPVATGPAEHRH